MGGLVEKPHPGKYSVMRWHTQAVSITNNHKVKVDFTLLALSSKNAVTCKFHVNDSAKGKYDVILKQDLLTEIGLNLRFSEHVIESDDGPFKGYT